MKGNNGDSSDLIKSWARKWGRVVSEAALDTSTDFFQLPDVDGFIGYFIKSNCAVVFGNPVCSSEEAPRLATAFHDHCRKEKLNIIYMIVSENFARWLIENLCSVLIEVGEELVFDPQNDPTNGHQNQKLRNYIHHAQQLGLTVHEYLSNDPKLEHSIEQVGFSWLKARHGPQIHLGHLDFFKDRIGKRWFYVKDKKDRVIAMALLSELQVDKGWLLKFLIAVPESPRGTTELLMNSILDTLRKEGSSFLTYGMVPSETLGEMIGLGKVSMWAARKCFKIVKWFFRLNQRKIYWQKFHPKTYPTYLLFSEPNIGLNEIQAMLKGLKIEFRFPMYNK